MSERNISILSSIDEENQQNTLLTFDKPSIESIDNLDGSRGIVGRISEDLSHHKTMDFGKGGPL